MSEQVVLLSVPGLREEDLTRMPRLAAMAETGGGVPLAASFPAVTCPSQLNLTTGALPREHGVVANGFYWRDGLEPGIGPKYDGVEMWTAWDDVVRRPRIWDRLREHDASLKSAVWFPLLAKGCGAEFVCTFAPIHNPDGSESLWCYTKPELMYGDLRDALGHFPLKHFWGPLANLESTRWIISSLLWLAERERPAFSYVYLPHLDYAAQKHGPDSAEAMTACAELDAQLGRLFDGVRSAWGEAPLWLVASEYAVSPVSHVVYPNRVLREAGLLALKIDDDGREQLDYSASAAWAMVDHQHGHVFVKDRDVETIDRVARLFRGVDGVARALTGDDRDALDHERSGDVVIVSEPHSWQAYYWWEDESLAPAYARTVDIHHKPGYDPVEMFWDPALAEEHGGGTPLDATRVRGSHGASSEGGVLVVSKPDFHRGGGLKDFEIAPLVLERFGV